MAARDDEEFEEFVAARLPQLRRLAFLIVRDWQHAEDVVQIALVKVYRAWPRIERRGALESYTRRAVVNASISWTRKPRREVVSDRIPDEQGPPHESLSLDEDLTALLARITPAQAAVIGLRFVDDLSIAEVARLLGITEGTVKSQTSRGLARLKELLDTSETRNRHG
jgi:RNA polymerase sigma-70 factor (sigma-E family)